MIPNVDVGTGALPGGRHQATLQEFEDAFAKQSTTREELWAEWSQATELLRSHVPVCAAWVGGSYLTSKVDPDDIDCVYLVDEMHIASLPDPSKAVLQAFASGKEIRNVTGLRLDTFVLQWISSAGVTRADPDLREYHSVRGYWDDLWSRLRSGAKSAAPVRLDSHPRRGYVEVILDGFSESGPFRTD